MKRLFLFVFALLLAQLSHAQWEDDFRLSDTRYFLYLLWNDHSLQLKEIQSMWYGMKKPKNNGKSFTNQSTDGGLTGNGKPG